MYLKLKLLLVSITFSCVFFGQETNCADGIDNDGDGQIDINDTDCQCNGGISTVPSFIPNPSFESNSSCPSNLAEMSKANNWNQASGGTIDYFACGYTRDTYAPPPAPPNGTAYVGAIYHNTRNGVPVSEFIAADRLEQVAADTKVGGATLTGLLGTSAWYAPGAAVSELVKAIALDSKKMFPCSTLLDGEYGLSDLCIGVPVILGKNGIEKIVTIDLSDAEKAKMQVSAEGGKKTNALLEL